uniref:PSP proline-rich domain-containing protein n=1 Tax=Pectinophora gossypiella TaxID=13191 RepID=A0A1E1WNL5_PECGO
MSKRKAGLNDIIYELDNDDIEISSEDEGKEAKIHCLDTPEKVIIPDQNNRLSDQCCPEVITLDCSTEGDCVILSPEKIQNGGKTSSEDMTLEEPNSEIEIPKQTDDVDSSKKINSDCCKTTIFNEDIVIDSPASNSDLGVVGCENRTPIVTVRFKDNKMAKMYKAKVKAFMLKLIKLHGDESLVGSDTETDLELDVWPEDLQDDSEEMKTQEEDNLFFVDTVPSEDSVVDIPRYSQNSSLIENAPIKEPTPPPTMMRRGPVCFNCDGAHPLRDCQLPRNNIRINENRKNMVKVGRYHVEDEQKYGHLVPGRISGQLRHALGLKRHELPMHIYRMRLLGYPPGWLEEARISHSGITMFDSAGRAIQDPEEEEGEVSEPGCKDKFDIKKILDFPGFNVAASSRYKEEAHSFGLPPMSEQDSKLAMLQMLAPNAMKAYKRKKLTFFPSAATNDSAMEGQAEMELDSGDETADFP